MTSGWDWIIEWHPIHYAARNHDVEALKSLLDKGTDPELRTRNEYSETPLHLWARHLWASEQSSQFQTRECFRLLLAAKANVNVLDSCGISPLNDAVVDCNPLMTSLLLENGAYINNGLLGDAFRYQCDDTRRAAVIELLLETGEVELDATLMSRLKNYFSETLSAELCFRMYKYRACSVA